ncbi:MAG: ATP-binding protein [Planctomycetaceae bacterium]
MNNMLRTGWTIEEVNTLPPGEHDYFDRKSGLLIEKGDFQTDFSKAFSAFANSGGGYIILGVKDDGSFDGVPRTKGRTCTREWIEQIIPNLVEPVPVAFRVHLVESSSEIVIPDNRVLLVIDITDSHLAPFQSRKTKLYFHRVGGHSLPASHFYLETLRNRQKAPSFSVEISRTRIIRVLETPENYFIQLLLKLAVTNEGTVTPSHWYVDLLSNDQRIANEGVIRRSGFPVFTITSLGNTDVQEQRILPGQTRSVLQVIGIFVDRLAGENELPKQVVEVLEKSNIKTSVITENHVGAACELDLSEALSMINDSNIQSHIPSFDGQNGTGFLGAGIIIQDFQLGAIYSPNDYIQFGGVIENSSNEHYQEFQLEVVFIDNNGNATAHRTVDIGILAPTSKRHWHDQIEGAAVMNYDRIEAFYYDKAWWKR